ncbi:MAG: ester cyclase [Planctomycetota bacterium]
MSEANKAVVQAYVDAFNAGDVDALCAQFHPEALVWGVLGWGAVPEVRPIWQDLVDCLGIQLQVDGMIAEGDVVAVRYTERGTSKRAFRGQGPTGRSYELTAMEWFELRDGKIYRRWGARDFASQTRQLGFQQ